MLNAARELFVAEGYPATTMERIAGQAGVAVQTVYYTFRTKAQLLCEVMEAVAAGRPEPEPVPLRPWMAEVMSAPSAHRALAVSIEHGTDIFERAAPLWPAMWAAAALDPAVDAYWQRVSTGRREAMGRIIARVAELGALRPSIDIEQGTDIFVVLVSHETYLGLVQRAQWTLPQYKAWLFNTASHQLITHPAPRSATKGLSFDVLVSPRPTDALPRV